MVRPRDFRDQDRGDTRQGTRANFGDDSSDKNKVERLCGSLESATDQGEESSDEYAVDTSDAVSSPSASEAAKDGTQVVLHCNVRNSTRIDWWHSFDLLY